MLIFAFIFSKTLPGITFLVKSSFISEYGRFSIIEAARLSPIPHKDSSWEEEAVLILIIPVEKPDTELV